MAKDKNTEKKPFNLDIFISEVKKELNPEVASRVGTVNALPVLDESAFLKMPEWWQVATKTQGLVYGQIVTIAGGTDSGKCHGKDTPIIMYDGSIKMVQDIVVGDLLMGPDSKPRKVLQLGRGRDELFKISSNGWTPWVCNSNHIMNLYSAKRPSGKFTKEGFYNVSVKEYLAFDKETQRKLRQHKVSVEFDAIKLDIDPYVFGYVTGNGSSDSIINGVSGVEEYFNFIKSKMNEDEFLNTIKKIKEGRSSGFPKNYIVNCRKVRMALLAGIIDAQGVKNEEKSYDISTINKTVAEQISFLAGSLGLAVTKQERTRKLPGDNEKTIQYKINISGKDIVNIPVLIQRKKITNYTGIIKSNIAFLNIESIGEGDYYGFTLDNDGLYLLGDFTVTHNTSTAIEAMKAAQSQETFVIYLETENKTTSERLTQKGIDSANVFVIPCNIAERAYQALFVSIRKFKAMNPDGKLLVIIDSMGNIVSQRSAEMDLEEASEKPGEKGKINRTALEILVSLVSGDSKIACLLINYTYANMGAPGKSIAGGNAIAQFSSLVYKTARKGWLEKTESGIKKRVGAKVEWTLDKNHIYPNNPGAKKVELDITDEGIRVAGVQEEE